jgi:hypothetical protein
MPASQNKKTLKRGSRRQVWNGSAEKTMGGLTKEQLMKNERGRIVSAKKCTTMRANCKTSDDEEEKPLVKKTEEEKPSKKSGGGFWESLF